MKITVILASLLLMTGAIGAEIVTLTPGLDLPDEGAGADAIVKTITRGRMEKKLHVIVGDYLYLTRSGPAVDIYDLVSLKREASIRLEREPEQILARGTSLVDDYKRFQPRTILSFDFEAPAWEDPYDSDAYLDTVKGVDPATFPPYFNCAFVDGGRIFMGTYGREASFWVRGEKQKLRLESHFEQGYGDIAIVNGKLMGFGSHVIYQLSPTLMPVRELYNKHDNEELRHSLILTLAGDGKTIAVLMRDRIQIRSADDLNVLLREEEISCLPIKSHALTHRSIIPFAGGYLYAGKELIWVHPDRSRPLWRCTPKGTERVGQVNYTVGSVDISHRRIIMVSDMGDMYIVDASKVLGRQLAPPTAEGGPKPLLNQVSATPAGAAGR